MPRRALVDAPVSYGGAEIRVTGSRGVAGRGRGEPTDAWIERADAACYRAKKGGRNRVEVADDVARPGLPIMNVPGVIHLIVPSVGLCQSRSVAPSESDGGRFEGRR